MKKFIIPYLKGLGYELNKSEFMGIFKTGDFKNDYPALFPAMLKGYPVNDTYVYLYVQKPDLKKQIRLTVKINSIFLSVRNVEYSKQL